MPPIKKGTFKKSTHKPFILVKPRRKKIPLPNRRTLTRDEYHANAWVNENFRAVKLPNGRNHWMAVKEYKKFAARARALGITVGELLLRHHREAGFEK